MSKYKLDLTSISGFFTSIGDRLSVATTGDVLFIILALAMPPVAVVLKTGLTGQLWLNIILTILGYIPGQIHALWVVLFM
jgi:uncharacterized membrane protein YqaE (UPF0057 family)